MILPSSVCARCELLHLTQLFFFGLLYSFFCYLFLAKWNRSLLGGLPEKVESNPLICHIIELKAYQRCVTVSIILFFNGVFVPDFN